MKCKLFLTFVLLSIASLAFAEIPIYCPKCKTHLYNYKHDKIIPNSAIYAKDFIPAEGLIPQPQEASPMVCPLDNAPLNGWEYWAWALNRDNKLVFLAVSLLTKGKDGEWVWIPYDIDLPELKELLNKENKECREN